MRRRALDLGTTRAYLEVAAPRVDCPEHGVVVAAVPWVVADLVDPDPGQPGRASLLKRSSGWSSLSGGPPG